jgi:ABC-type transport system involved in cytochrome c biogenesis permease subunit
MRTQSQPKPLLTVLKTQSVIVGVIIVVLTYVVFKPLLAGGSGQTDGGTAVVIPVYDYTAWRALPVQHSGRVKPFESAAEEILREVYGRARFEDPVTGKKYDAVPVVLQWMMTSGTTFGDPSVDWETYPFILCPNHELRQVIYAHLASEGQPLSEEQLHGKFVAPADLRSSPRFAQLVTAAEKIREEYKHDDFTKIAKPLELKAEEVAGRLSMFDQISQNAPMTPAVGKRRQQRAHDPLGVVALDRVRGGAWFSVGEARTIRQEPDIWKRMMQDRLARLPQLYLSPEYQTDLKEFQDQIKAGTARTRLTELAAQIRQRDEKTLEELAAVLKAGNEQERNRMLIAVLQTEDEFASIRTLLPRDSKQSLTEENRQQILNGVRVALERRHKDAIEDLERRVQKAPAMKYHPDDPRFKMLHFDYLENRFPNVYLDSLAAQKPPTEEATQVVASFDYLKEAYQSNDPEQFADASSNYFTRLRDTSAAVDDYPGTTTLGLEMLFNRVQPFRWAWVIMLLSVMAFVASVALHSRFAYGLGWVFYFASVGFQLFGFYARVAISGRPPVSNMYETVIWVSFMSGIFALILELVYRRTFIIMAGALVATFGLVLADQLPMALDPKISPLTPVLRSNYWLTIHVLTIVSSYAGGTLAWGLANITLAMMAFGKGRKETLHTLSQFTYRAMQIAVLLLAAGTFLGGWWAAESWGRFWGWDPKEVWALIALVCYVIPLHARYIGWVKDFGLAVSAVLCYAAIVMCWYGVNFVLGAGLHSYGFGGGGPWWVFWAGMINIEWVIIASILYTRRMQPSELLEQTTPAPASEESRPLETSFKPGLGNL